jgi:hypothetical protein
VPENPSTENPRWIPIIKKSPPHNPVTHNSNFVCPHFTPHHARVDGTDIFPFLNFSNHGQHGVDIEKYIRALPEEEQRPYLLLERYKKARKAVLEMMAEKSRREGSEGDVEEGKD